MPEVYQLADYTILASLYDPLALVAIESILNGTPAIMAYGMGCHEVIDSHVIKGFNPHSYDSLRQCMSDLKIHPIQKLSEPYQKYIKYPIEKTYPDHLQEIINLIVK